MSSSIDNIWDEPLTDTTTEPSSSSKPALFLPGSDEETSDHERPSASADLETVEDIFASNMPDEDEEFAPLGDIPDVQRIRRQEEERLRKEQPIPESTPARDAATGEDDKTRDGIKPKRKIAKLDENRLIDSIGFPQLIHDTQHFKPKGKGYEVEDLNRLIGVYQFWTHRLYPKTKFRDTVQRVEDLCHSRRMQNNLSMWRDKENGKETAVIDMMEDNGDSDSEEQTNTAAAVATTARSSSPARAPTAPPSSASEFGDDEDDIDIEAMIREDERQRQKATQSSAPSGAMDVENNDEEDMWNLVRELEDETTTSLKRPEPTKGLSVEDDWEDLYA